MTSGLTVLISLALLFAIPAPLSAADITVGGEIRIRGRYRQDRDFDKTNLPTSLDRARLDERSRIRVSAKIDEGLSAYLELESYGRFGFGASSPQANTEDTFGREGAGVPAFRFAWIDARLPATPVTFRLGRQPLAFGHGYVFDTQIYGGDAITARGPLFGWNWEIGWVKTRESDITGFARDYPSGYAQPGATPGLAAGAGTAGTGTPGVDNDEEYFTFKIKGSPATDHVLELYSVTHRDAGIFVTPIGPSASAPYGSQSGGGAFEDTIGVAWNARLGPFVPRAEVAYQFGTAYKLAVPRRDGGNTVTRSAYMFHLGTDYNLTPQWRISLDAALGSGNGKNPTDPDFKDNHAFFQVNPYPNVVQWPFAADLDTPGSFNMGNGVTNRRFEVNGLNDLGFVDLAVAWTPLQQWTFRVEATKLFAHRTFDGMGGIATTKPPRNLGWNLGGDVTYRPYRNLTTNWVATVWIPGRYFDGGIPAPTPAQLGGKPGPRGDTAIILRWYALVSF